MSENTSNLSNQNPLTSIKIIAEVGIVIYSF